MVSRLGHSIHWQRLDVEYLWVGCRWVAVQKQLCFQNWYRPTQRAKAGTPHSTVKNQWISLPNGLPLWAFGRGWASRTYRIALQAGKDEHPVWSNGTRRRLGRRTYLPARLLILQIWRVRSLRTKATTNEAQSISNEHWWRMTLGRFIRRSNARKCEYNWLQRINPFLLCTRR